MNRGRKGLGRNPSNQETRVISYQNDTEQAVLGAILKEPVKFDDVFAVLPGSYMFQHAAHRMIYQAMIKITEGIDLVNVIAKLLEMKLLEKAGGRVYLVELQENVASTANVVDHAERVAEKYRLQQLRQIGREITGLAEQPEAESSLVIDRAESSLLAITHVGRQREPQSIGSLLPDAFERIQQYHTPEGLKDLVTTGFSRLDYILFGFEPALLHFLGGRPSHGKTQLALQVGEHAARSGTPTLFVTMEMPSIDMSTRQLFTAARVDSARGRRGELQASEWDSLTHAQARLLNLPLYFIAWGGITMPELKSLVRRQMRRLGIGFVVVDYLQIMNPGIHESRQVAIANLSGALKALAMDMNIPVLVCSQLRRFSDREVKRRPRLDDLRESGAIEQDADKVIFVYHDQSKKEPVQEIIVAKHRNGPLGIAKMSFVCGRWENKTSQEDLPY